MNLHRPWTLSSTRTRGAALIITLLLLAIISMFAVSSFTASSTNMRVTGNMVTRQEAAAAAQSVIETTISSTTFTTDPIAVAAAPYAVDVDADGAADYQVNLTPAPSCQKVRVIKVLELDPASAADKGCMTSSGSDHSGIEDPSAAAATGDSMCAATQWNIRAVVDDPRTGTHVAINQGIDVRVPKTDAADLCT